MDNVKMKDIRDDEIRIIGKDSGVRYFKEKKKSNHLIWLIVAIVALASLLLYILWPSSSVEVNEITHEVSYSAPLSHDIAPATTGYTEIRDTVVNDIELRLYIPHATTVSLSVGKPDKTDTTIVLIAQAADIRGDNGEITGSFVLNGKVMAKGSSKEGFCAIINNNITVGVNKNSSLFEQAIEENGYFFRQFSLVNSGVMEESNPKGKSIRRALCQRGTEVFVIESQSRESFHDFSQTLEDIGMDNAIYLVGSYAYGWAIDKNGTRHEFGDENQSDVDKFRNINYIVWR